MNKIRLNLLAISFFALFIGMQTNLFAQTLTYSVVLHDSLQNGIKANSVANTLDNGYVMAGVTSGEAMLMRLDSASNIIWNKKIGSSGNEAFNSVVATYDSGFVAAGKISAPSPEVFVAKYSSSGNAVWSTMINLGGGGNVAYSIQQCYDSGYVVTGNSSNGVFIAKLDMGGNLTWSKNFHICNNSYYSFSVKQVPADSGYVICGYYENYPPYDPNAFMIRFAQDGTVIWAKRYHGSAGFFPSAKDVVVNNVGFLCIMDVGASVTLMQTDFAGAILWTKSYFAMVAGNLMDDLSPKLHKTHDHGYAFVKGSQFSQGQLFKIDSSGNMQWSKVIENIGLEALEAKDSGLYVVGNGPIYGVVINPNISSPQIGIVKTDSLGIAVQCIYDFGINITNVTILDSLATITALADGIGATLTTSMTSIVILSDSGCVNFFGGIKEQQDAEGFSVFPNPSCDKVNIVLKNRTPNDYTICMFDVIGTKVLEIGSLLNKETTLDISMLPQGVYFLELNGVDNGKLVHKIVKL